MITPLTTSSLTLAQTLPQGGTAPLIAAVAAGLILWLSGARLVKPVFLLLGLAIGGFLGATLVPLTGLTPFDISSFTVSPGLAGLTIGAVLGALVSLALFRLVITISAALTFAAAGLMGAMVFLHFNPTTNADTTDQETALVESGESLANSLGDTVNRDAAERAIDLFDDGEKPLLTEDAKQDILDAAERSRAFIKQVSESITAELEQRPTRDKAIAFGSLLGGLMLGLLVGITLPNRAAALVTALFGSAIWISASAALVSAKNGALPNALDRSAVVWAAAWILATLAGLIVQLGFLKRSPKRSDDADDDE